jgi:hypothetical protein
MPALCTARTDDTRTFFLGVWAPPPRLTARSAWSARGLFLLKINSARENSARVSANKRQHFLMYYAGVPDGSDESYAGSSRASYVATPPGSAGDEPWLGWATGGVRRTGRRGRSFCTRPDRDRGSYRGSSSPSPRSRPYGRKAAREVGRILKHVEFGTAISPDFRKYT